MKHLLVFIYICLNFGLIFSTSADEINFSKLSTGNVVSDKIFISKKLQIPLPEGNWKVLKKINISTWDKSTNIIFVKETNKDPIWFSEFLEINVSKPVRDKYYPQSIKFIDDKCGKKEISFTIQKSFKKGNSINCFASGLINNPSSHFTPNDDMTIRPWSFDFKETLGIFGNRPILISMSAYSSTSQTNRRNITVIHGSSLEYFANENQLDTEDYNSTKDVWFFKSIENYQNFQNNMNVKESHKISVEDEYQIYQKKYAQLDKTKTITNTKKNKKEKKFVTSKKVSDKELANILYEKILENKNIKKSKYIRTFKIEENKIKLSGTSNVNWGNIGKIRSMLLAVYLNDEIINALYNDSLEAESLKLVYGWESANLIRKEIYYNNDLIKTSDLESFGNKATYDCQKKAKNLGLKNGKCYFVDYRRLDLKTASYRRDARNLLKIKNQKVLIEDYSQIADIKILNETQPKDIDVQQEDKNIKIVRKKVSDDKVIANLDAPGSKFFKLNEGDTINNNIIEINKNKIPLPDGNWRVVKSKNPSSWGKAKTFILTKDSSANNQSLEEFIEITVTSVREKNYLENMAQFKKPCKKKYNFQTIQKKAGGGQSSSCFVSGIYFSSGFQISPQAFMPWNYAFRDYFTKIPNELLFSLSGYASPKYTSKNFITVMYGSSINNIIKTEELNIANENNLNEKSEKLIRNIWRKKTINFHNNFQNAMNFNESHFVSLEDDYNLAEKLIADLSTTEGQKQKVKKIIKKEKKTKEKLVVDKEVSEKQKKIADKKAKAEKKKKLAEKKIEEEEKKLVEKKAKEEAENQKILASTNIDTEITNDENSKDSKNFLEALAKKEVLEYNKKKIIRYECQQPWDLTTEDYRPLLDIYELDLEDRVLIGTHRYITDKEYTEERTYPILAKDKDRVLVRYDSPNGNFSTKFFFNYGTDQSIVAVDNSYKTQARCVNRDYFVDIKIAKKKVDNLELSKKDLKALEEAKNEALLAEKEIKEIEKEQAKLLVNQEKILKKQKQATETTKVAKLKIYEDPKKLSKSFSSSISKSKFSKYNATSTVSYLFFESSENYLISLELLYRAYDLNTEAEKIRSHISYMKESKSSENQRLKSTRQIVQNQSATISNNIRNDSIELTEQGRVYYAQSLPYALNAAIATYNLYHVAINTVNNVGQSGDVVFGILNNLNNVIGIAQILPQIPSYSKNMYQTTKLIITGAKTKKIKESRSTEKALDDLNLDIS